MPVYQLDDGSFLIDDLSVDYDQLRKEAAAQAAIEGMFNTETESDGPVEYSPNDLWLQLTSVTNAYAFLALHNTVSNQPYALLTKANLSWSNWTAELRVTGTVSNVTPAQLPTRDRTNLFVWARSCTSSNLTVNSNQTALALAQLLVGNCVTVTNATYSGAVQARGTFTNGICAGLPIDAGVILSSGDITNAIGPNDSDLTTTPFWTNADVNLDELLGLTNATVDAAVLEFDIVSSNAFVLQFAYAFASEEYPEWVGPFNDPMGIFGSTNRDGTNWIITTTNNIAVVPGSTNLVSVNTINENVNAQYYVDNGDPVFSSHSPVANIEYDGMTVLLSARVVMAAHVPHHIKIAIADYNDVAFDSAVFIKAASPCP